MDNTRQGHIQRLFDARPSRYTTELSRHHTHADEFKFSSIGQAQRLTKILKLYKVVDSAGHSIFCNRFSPKGKWGLPAKNGCPLECCYGEWKTVTGPLVSCQNGLHLATELSLRYWLNLAQRYYSAGQAYRAEIFEVDVSPRCGVIVKSYANNDEKVIVGKARLTRIISGQERRKLLTDLGVTTRSYGLYQQLY